MKQHSVSRRNLLQLGTAFVGAGSLTAWLGSGALARTVHNRVDRTQVAQGSGTTSEETLSTLTPDEALAKLTVRLRRSLRDVLLPSPPQPSSLKPRQGGV